ncbi:MULTISPECIES: hypothetical protein [unclassified Flavobacterium]|uniref:hypothetical protein n=1 Tax=unclassified Flavobacterium TaxID=196869 RepID=UPI00131BAEEC|nr:MULTISPECIES: hypothetical protein [unclassified Flavobacterium]
MKRLLNKYHLSFVFSLAFVIFAKAQPPILPPPGDPPEFPVDDYVFIAVIGAVFLGYYLIGRHIKKENL